MIRRPPRYTLLPYTKLIRTELELEETGGFLNITLCQDIESCLSVCLSQGYESFLLNTLELFVEIEARMKIRNNFKKVSHIITCKKGKYVCNKDGEPRFFIDPNGNRLDMALAPILIKNFDLKEWLRFWSKEEVDEYVDINDIGFSYIVRPSGEKAYQAPKKFFR